MLVMKLNLETAAQKLAAYSKSSLSDSQRAEAAVELAAQLLGEANRIQSNDDKKIQAQLARMMDDPQGKLFTTNMTDECFRSENNRRIANQLVHLIHKHGVPKYLDGLSRVQLGFFKHLGEALSGILIPMVKKMIRKETSKVILPGESSILEQHIHERKLEGVTTNLNHLGEAILGEGEAAKKLATYLQDLEKKNVEYISVKISTLSSQLNLLSWDETINTLKEKLRILYRHAMKNKFTDPEGNSYHKFVNLDMEEYRDLHLTLDLFKSILDEEEFLSYKGGIVLQAYLPDSYEYLKELTEWSKERIKRGGNCIKVRVVKGANLAMEKVEASLLGWEQAPYASKIEVDANYKRMLHYATLPENAAAVNIGVASHNLFDISYAMILVAERKVEKQVNFEMLEGMAEHIRKVVQELTHGIILYCPAAEKHEFQHAIAYLIRRLDENTSPENFLRHAFNLKPGTEKFKEQAKFFIDGCKLIDSVSSQPRRKQNRLQQAGCLPFEAKFANEADTDFCLPENRKWAEQIIADYHSFKTEQLPMVIAGEEILSPENAPGTSPNTGEPFFSYSLANQKQIESVLHCAEQEFVNWNKKKVSERSSVLKKTAAIIRRRRAELIKIMMLETGKHLMEADVEVSEAIDFCEYYSRSMEKWAANKEFSSSGLGPVLVTPPWNFPCAIPLGGVAAALVTGNTVIFKPAPEAILTGWQVAKAFYDAGVSKKVLQFVTCSDDPEGSMLVSDSRIKACILTGATETARLFMKMNPALNLMAETGGKNTIIVSDLCDRDLAVKDIVQSAFGHAGQKCSACSLAILEKNVYEDKSFLETLRDAAASLKVAPSYDPASKINPLIHRPHGKLLKALTTLEDGEEWLLKPQQDAKNPQLWSPGIKLGVKPGSFTFTTEFFGPVLGLVKAGSVKEAVDLANSSGFGLTGGIHSLDDREKKYWLDNIQVGNAYINRSITGAIVRRQPFGGLKNSSFGRGFKAGGPDYLVQLMNIKEQSFPKEINNVMSEYNTIKEILSSLAPAEVQTWEIALGSYQYNLENHFQKKEDPSQINGQENYLLYTPVEKVQFFVRGSEDCLDIYRVITAAHMCGSPIDVFCTEENAQKFKLMDFNLDGVAVKVASEEQLLNEIGSSELAKTRIIDRVPEEWQKKAAENFVSLQANPVYSSGRLELLNYLKSTSVSDNFHRYGNLGCKSQQTTKDSK